MDDRTMPLLCAIAFGLWLVGLSLALFELIGWVSTGHVGVVIACAGGTLHIRGFVRRLERNAESAFNLGRDYERSRSLTSIH